MQAGTKLEQLLKFADLVATGGEAKHLIQGGDVAVNGERETRRGYKVREGDIVEVGEETIRVSLHE